MQDKVLIDTGPLVAFLDRRDTFHSLCKRQFEALPPVFTSWAVLTEVAWLLRGRPTAILKMLDLLDAGAIFCLEPDADFPGWCKGFYQRYKDLKPQLADATLVYLADALNTKTIFTIDRRDFAVFRTENGEPFVLLPEELI